MNRIRSFIGRMAASKAWWLVATATFLIASTVPFDRLRTPSLAALPAEKVEEPDDSEIGLLRVRLARLQASLPSLEAQCVRDRERLEGLGRGSSGPYAYRASPEDTKRAISLVGVSAARLNRAKGQITDIELKIRELQHQAEREAEDQAEAAEREAEKARSESAAMERALRREAEAKRRGTSD